jgi:glycosyltransferase involved in cell wall biosynthesis
MTAHISVALIAHNEETTAARALESSAWASEIIFVDCGSSDGTAAIAEARANAGQGAGVRLFRRENNPVVYVNKQFAADQASGDWIFILDADEEITPELREEILRAAASDGGFNAYEMPRKNFYFGRWLRHGGKYPDTQLRLFRKGKARFLPLPIHEKLETEGPIGRLTSPLNHYPYRSVQDIPRKLGFYAEALSEGYLQSGKGGLAILLRPLTRFFSGYILKLGFLDGTAGLKTALMDFIIVLTSVLRFLEKTDRGRN